MNKLSIGYFADGPWSHEAFKLLNHDPSIDIKFIVPRTDTKDNTLEKFSKENKIDYLLGEKINSSSFIERAKKYECDLFVSMSFNQIFKKEIINIPRLKTINCHAGKLPFYRGRNVLNWVLINDEKEFGITVHYIDEGIDTGDIILQRVFPINDQDDYSSLLSVAYKECAKILYDSIKLLQKGGFKTIKQSSIHAVGFYCGRRKEGDEVINWNQNSRDIFNFVRALSKPGPIARTSCKGAEVCINKVRLVQNSLNYKSIVGQIVGKEDNTLTVKTGDNVIRIIEYACNEALRVGDRFDF